MKPFSPFYHKGSRKRAQGGLTLTEVLLSMIILAFVVSGILTAYISCAALVTTSKNVNIATNAAFGLIEEIRSSSFADIVDDYNGLNFVVNDIPSSRGVVYVDDTDPEFLKVTISVCWRQGTRIIGGDLNLNGAVEPGEYADNDGIFDSPVQLATQIANR